MKEKLVREVQHGMLGVLDQRQQEMLKSVLLRCLDNYTVKEEQIKPKINQRNNWDKNEEKLMQERLNRGKIEKNYLKARFGKRWTEMVNL